MRNLLKASGIVTALAFAALAPGALAQQINFKQTCQLVGGFTPEPLGDRDGHSISVAQVSCHVESGPMNGGNVTGNVTMEWDKTNAVLVTSSGVIRKPGGFAAYQDTEGQESLTITDSKVTGFTYSGKGRWPIATGSAASLAGKTYVLTVKSIGAGQWEADYAAE